MAPKSLLAGAAALAAAGLLAACSGDDGDGGTGAQPAPRGCPVAAEVVEDALGHPVTVRRSPSGRGSCAYAGLGGARAGALVEVAVRRLDGEDAYEAALAAAERRAGPATALEPGAVDGAERGWTLRAGRAVQLAAAAGDRLVVVAVVDPDLDAGAAAAVAADLAAAALEG